MPTENDGPLQVLIERESTFSSELRQVIQKAAAAWSRNNLPPPELDNMFRAIEGIYRFHKGFLASLRQLQSESTHISALGDTLIRLAPSVCPVYSKYVESLWRGFDTLPSVLANAEVNVVLANMELFFIDQSSLFLSLSPHIWNQSGIQELSLSPPLRRDSPTLTLDAIFLIPLVRLHEFRLIYQNIHATMSTRPNCDAEVLNLVNESLDIIQQLLVSGCACYNRLLPGGADIVSPPPWDHAEQLNEVKKRFFVDTVGKLEMIMETSSVRDIFTLSPKKCRLQINSPSLPFTRTIRKASHMRIRFSLSSNMGSIDITNGFAVLLEDLFLLSELKLDHQNQPKLYLLFPPLAGKHLSVSQCEERELGGGFLAIDIMKKEQIILEVEENVASWNEAFLAASTFHKGTAVSPSRGLINDHLASPPPPTRTSSTRQAINPPQETGELVNKDTTDRGAHLELNGALKASANPVHHPIHPPISPISPAVIGWQQQQHVIQQQGGYSSFEPEYATGPPSRAPSWVSNQSGGSDQWSQYSSRPDINLGPQGSFLHSNRSQDPGNRNLESSASDIHDVTPPGSPVPLGPTKTVVTAQMRCKCFHQQTYQQWKNLGSAQVKLFVSSPGNRKQIVVESDKGKSSTPFVSTIVLTDGVERVGKTGVAIELSDDGKRTGIVYLLQLKNEETALGLYNELLKGSDRKK